MANVCKFKEAQCYHCKKTGHISKKCRCKTNRGDNKPRKTHHVQADGEETEDSYSIFTLQGGSEDAMRIQLTMNDIPISMEFDTGAAMS